MTCRPETGLSNVVRVVGGDVLVVCRENPREIGEVVNEAGDRCA